MLKLKIDGKDISVEQGTTILEAAKKEGIEIPHFCYHPAISITGSCRMCLVEVNGKEDLVISCKEEVKDGLEVFTNTDKVKKARESVLEFLLINHPLDCPICDKSGECNLQNYYYKYSLKSSRFKEDKIRKTKAKQIGKYIILDTERCVLCTRCVRFLNEITKTEELVVSKKGDKSEIDICKGFELNNPYSMCVVDLCPVGALTNTDFRFKKPVWFLKTKKSVCNGCATCCDIFVDYNEKEIFRFRPYYNDDNNKYWICDYGRFSYKQFHSEYRVLSPIIYSQGLPDQVSWEQAIKQVEKIIEQVDAKDLAGVLSARSTNEENKAFFDLFENKLKIENIYYSSNINDEDFEDNILRSKDKNPNLKGVLKFTDKKIDESIKEKVWIILDELTDQEIKLLESKKVEKIILITSHHDTSITYPDIVLSKASWLEQNGSFTNKNGEEKIFERVFEPIGDAKTGKDIARLLTYESI